MRSARTARYLRTPIQINDRNRAEIFAHRARKNLDFVVAAAAAGDDVHPVTQSVCALMGIIVLPIATDALHRLKRQTMSDLYGAGWPRWDVSGTKRIDHFEQFIRELRNAASHSSLQFDSDSREPSDVTVTFESKSGDWVGRIKGDKLIEFCRRIADGLNA